MLKSFIDLMQGKEGEQKDLMLTWRKRVFFIILLSSLLGALFPYLTNIKLALSEGLIANAVIYSSAYLIAIVVTFWKAIPFTVRAWSGLSLFFLVGAVSLVTYGPMGSGRVWLLIFATLASLFLGLRAGIMALALNIVFFTLWVFGWSISYFSWVDASQLSVVLVTATVSSFLFISSIVTISIGILIRYLSRGLAREQKLSREYRFLADNINDMIWTMDLETQQFTYISQAVEKLRGFTAKEALGQSLEEIFTPESLNIALEVLSEEMAGDRERDPDRSVTLEFEQYRKDRTTIWTESKISFIRDNENCPVAILGVTRDISERKSVEEAVKESEAKFRTLVEYSPQAIVVFDTDPVKIVDANIKASELYGLAAEELLQSSIEDVNPPLQPDGSLSVETAMVNIQEALEGKAPVFEWTHFNVKENREIPCEVRLVRLPSSGRKLIMASTTDISVRKLAEEALRASEAKFRLVVERANEGIVVIQDDRYKFVNDYMLDIFKMSREEVLSSELMSMVHPDDRQMLFDRVRTRMNGQPVPEVVEHRIIDGEGNLRWIETRGVLSDWEGQPATIAFATDTTERKRFKESLKQSETRFRGLVEMAPEPIFVHHDGVIVYANSAFFSSLGISCLEDLQEKKVWEIVAPKDSELLKKRTLMQQQLSESVPLQEFNINTFDGRKLIFESTGRGIVYDSKPCVITMWRDITERKLAEGKLRASEERFRILFEDSPDAVFIVTLDDQYLEANTAASRMLGYSRDEFKAMTVPDLQAPEVQGEKGTVITEELARGGSFETLDMRKDGTIFPVEVHTQKVNLMGEEVVLSVVRDITERKLAEENLRASEERFRILFEDSPDAVFIETLDDQILDANTAASRMLGYSRDEFKAMTVPDLQAPEVRGEKGTVITEELARGGSFETLDIRKDGTIISVEVNKQKIKLMGKDVVLSVVRDITERKRVEEELAQIFNLSLDLICIASIDTTTFLRVNPAFTATLGYSEEELLDRSFMEFIHPDDIEPTLWTVNEELKKGKSVINFANRYRHRSGEYVWLNWISQPIPEKGITFAVAHNITDEKKMVEAREKLESQLRQAQKMEAVGTLAGGIAHDFNNILAAIMGYSELALVDAEMGKPRPRYIKSIIQAGERAKDLVNQILTFSRKKEPELKPVNLNHIIVQAKGMLERTIPKMIRIERRLAEDLWLTNADPSQISQVLMNLGTNARDAMPDGGLLLFETMNATLSQDYVDKYVDLSPGEYVLLTVSDTGHGMDAETIEQIFEPFFTKKGVGQGTGLGLATVYGIVKAHNGHIRCYSEVGRGTSFKVYLPVIWSEEPDRPGQNEPMEAPNGHETILLVDDEESIRDLAQEMLTRRGYKVVLAATGEEALDIYGRQGEDIDLIILDISMPGMGGHKCLEELIVQDPGAKVIVASGYSLNDPLEEGMVSGASAFVPKPFSLNDLLISVRNVLDK